jgi:hypothetical protein
MSTKEIPTALVKKTSEWLGDDGKKFFSNVKAKHGEINACWDDGGIPHPVHFREGMQVRNFMRMSGLCETWSDDDFDDNWIPLIEAAIQGS